MKKIILPIVTLFLSLPCIAVQKTNDDVLQIKSTNQKQLIFIRTGKTPTVYDPYYSKETEITYKKKKIKEK